MKEMVLPLNQIMERKLSLLYELYKHTNQEYIYANEEGIGLLGNILKEKQELMSEIDHLDRKFLVGFSDLKQELGVSSLDDLDGATGENFASLKLNAAEIMSVLEKIDAMDKEVQQKINKLRDDVTQDLARIKKQRQANKVYAEESAKNVMRDFGVYDVSKSSSFDTKK